MAAIAVGLGALLVTAPLTTAHSTVAPTAHSFKGMPTVGALFRPNAYPVLHTCTASVVRSRSRDVIVTAAHCMDGNGTGYDFAPGYDDGMTPYGIWRVRAGYGNKAWLRQSKNSIKHDWAFLRVANETSGGRVIHLEDVTGGNRLGTTVKPHQEVTVPGYVLGTADKPITCTTRAYRHHGYPGFDCGGYEGGVSGSAWLHGHGEHRSIVGVIGGLHQGGCSPATSYSSPLGNSFRRAFQRAENHRPADTFPSPPSDGC